jgi:alpha-maltose-1-phosphate synthase
MKAPLGFEPMRALIVTNEFPPHVYGGAGVHVDYLTRELRKLIEVEVRSFAGEPAEEPGWLVRAYDPAHAVDAADAKLQGLWATLSRDIGFVADPIRADVVHCHTWYTHLAGILAKLAYGIPLVITVHSLEPLRPWKREQLGGGYDVSTWIERTALEMADAVVAVSGDTRQDVLRLFDVRPERVRVIHNGIDTSEYSPTGETTALEGHGVDPSQPYVLFVGRVTRQKGIIHLVRAIRHLDPEIGVVLAAGQPDTPEIAAEMEAGVAEARRHHPRVTWIPEMLDLDAKVQLYSHAAVFCCPSVYEPFGIINLEAMACGCPVVASRVGGIPEVVVDGETGVLVPLELRTDEPMAPVDAAGYERALAEAINALVADPARRRAMGEAGRRRAAERFSWRAIAGQTVELYRTLAGAEGAHQPQGR